MLCAVHVFLPLSHHTSWCTHMTSWLVTGTQHSSTLAPFIYHQERWCYAFPLRASAVHRTPAMLGHHSNKHPMLIHNFCSQSTDFVLIKSHIGCCLKYQVTWLYIHELWHPIMNGKASSYFAPTTALALPGRLSTIQCFQNCTSEVKHRCWTGRLASSLHSNSSQRCVCPRPKYSTQTSIHVCIDPFLGTVPSVDTQYQASSVCIFPSTNLLATCSSDVCNGLLCKLFTSGWVVPTHLHFGIIHLFSSKVIQWRSF